MAQLIRVPLGEGLDSSRTTGRENRVRRATPRPPDNGAPSAFGGVGLW
jgi:hypothetical protein